MEEALAEEDEIEEEEDDELSAVGSSEVLAGETMALADEEVVEEGDEE